jgi:hypothetical protein
VGVVDGSKLRGNINTLLHEDPFKEGVFVAEHKDLIGGTSGRVLQLGELFFVVLNGEFKMLDVFCSAFSKCYFDVSTNVSRGARS